MRYLRWVGLVSVLLFVGILGGLMAPLPSEAVPTLTVQIDGVTVAPSGQTSFLIASPTTCNGAETTAGFTQCYGIRTSTTAQFPSAGTAVGGRKYTIRNAPNSTARLRIAEKVGQDKMSLVGVQFVPVPWTTAPQTTNADKNTNEQHVLTITLVNPFDNATVNVNNAQTYVWAMRTGGEFRAGPTTATGCAGFNGVTTDGLCDAIGDSVTFAGTGTFSPILQNVDILRPAGSPNNTQTLSFTVAGPHEDPILSYDGLTNATMGQVDPTYPRFLCTNIADGITITPPAFCRPTITQTMTVTLKGQDTFVLTGGMDAVCADCPAQLSAQQQLQLKFLAALVTILDWWEDNHPNARLRAFITSIELILAEANQPPSDPSCPGAKIVTIEMANLAGEDARDFVAHNAVAGIPEPPHYYAVISDPGVSWETAKSSAAALGDGWHLATITSGAEQMTIKSLLPDPTIFPAEPAQQYWIGGEQQSEADEPGGNWQWITGEGIFWNNGPFNNMYQNWGNEINGPGVGLQPDNVCNDSGCQNHLSLDHRYGWGWDDNDQFRIGVILGYVAEGPSPLPVID